MPELGALARVLASEGRGVLVVDCPPYDADVSRVVFQAAHTVVVPVTTSPLDVLAAAPVLESLHGSLKRGLVVLTMVDHRSSARLRARAALAHYGVRVADTEVARRVAHVEAVAAHLPVTLYERDGKAAAEMLALAGEVATLLEV